MTSTNDDYLDRPYRRQPEGDREVSNVTSIGAMTIGQAGWRRINSQTMLWTSELIGEGHGRNVLRLRGRGRSLGITAAWLPGDIDPDDIEAVSDEIEDEWESVLPLPALIVLRSALDAAIGAMEEAAGRHTDPTFTATERTTT